MATALFSSFGPAGLTAAAGSRFIVLQAGQALAIDGDRVAGVVLVEGEAMLREPARWIAGQVVLSPARRLVAPEPWRATGSVDVLAVDRVKLLVQDRPGLARWLAAALCAVAERVRGMRRRSPSQSPRKLPVLATVRST